MHLWILAIVETHCSGEEVDLYGEIERPVSGTIGANPVPLNFQIYLDMNNICN